MASKPISRDQLARVAKYLIERPKLQHVQLAELLKISEHTIRRHRKLLDGYSPEQLRALCRECGVEFVEPQPETPEALPSADDIPHEKSAQELLIRKLRDDNARLEREKKEIYREILDEQEVRRMIGVLAAAPSNPPKFLTHPAPKIGKKTPEVLMTSWADWHGGEVVSGAQLNGVNEFNLAILEQRVERLVERTIMLAKEHGPGAYPGAVVNLIGDFVSGGLHPELLKTDEEDVGPAVLRIADLLVAGLTRMADAFGHVYAPAVCGNHGRMTAKPEFKDYVYKNCDWLIYQFVRKRLEDRGEKRIRIDVRSSNEVYYRVFNMRFLAVHGDMLGVKGGDGIIGSIGPITRGEIKVRGWAESSQIPYDMLVMGHWHQPLWLPRVIVANTLKGYCEYAKNQLRAPITTPSQPLWFNHPKYGITSRWEVKVAEIADAPAAEWVSVFNPAQDAA